MLDDKEYLEGRDIYIKILENRKVKPKSHDAYLAYKKREALYLEYNNYRGYIFTSIIAKEHSYNYEYIDELINNSLNKSSEIIDKVINGFWDYDYSDEALYSFPDTKAIMDSILRLHYEENSKNGLTNKIIRINRLIVDNASDILSSDLSKEEDNKLKLDNLINKLIALFKELDEF